MWVFGKLKMYLIGAAMFVAAFVAAYLKGKSAGKQDIVNEHNRRRIDAMKQAKDVRDEIMDDPYLVDRAQRWMRSDDDR